MPGPYTRVASGDPGNSGATSAVTLINAHSESLEALEAGAGGPAVTNVLNEGVVCDGIQVTVNTTSGSSTVTVTASSLGTASVFTAGDVGKAFHIDRNVAAVAWSRLTIATYVSPTQVTLSAAVPSTMTGASAVFGTNNTTAISSVLSGAADYESVYFPAGEAGRFYLTDGGHTVNVTGLKVFGDGAYNSIIVTSHSTNDLFSVTSSLNVFENLHLKHAAAFSPRGGSYPTYPTDGAGIRADAGSGYGWVGANVNRVQFQGFYMGLEMERGIGMNVAQCFFYDHVLCGVHVTNWELADSGSTMVTDCDFYSDITYSGGAVAGIIFRGGAGSAFMFNRFFRGCYGILMDVWGDPLTNIRIIGNSMEDFNDQPTNAICAAWRTESTIGTGCGVGIAMNTSSFLHSVVIANNTLNTILGGKPVVLKGKGSGSSLSIVTVTGNSSTASSAFCEVDSYLTNARITGNQSYGAQTTGTPGSGVTVL